MLTIKTPSKIQDYSSWKDLNIFSAKLKAVQSLLKYNDRYDDKKKEIICTSCKKKVHLVYFSTGKYKWDSFLYHIVNEHQYKPDKIFINFIMEFNVTIPTNIKNITTFNSKQYTINDLKYVKLTRNQLMIFDALMEHGGYKKKYHSYSKKKLYYRHSEHSGLLDFDNNGLERVIVSGRTDRKDPNDTSIFLPQNMEDAIDYEYIFHTHPPTNRPGGRVTEGILYEFPSVSDIFHFIDHFNDGITQGSLIITPEGLYNIRKVEFNRNKIKINETELMNNMSNIMIEIQDDAIAKYSKNFTNKIFYSEIAQDKTHIHRLNNLLEKYGITVDYFPRSQDNNGSWILQEIYLPVFIIEPKR